MADLRVWVVTPELHRRGGTERCLAEQIERWRNRFTIRLYTMRLEDVDTDGIEVRMIPDLPGPHLLRYSWWFLANQVWRAHDRLAGPGPDVVHSPGVNSLDATAVSVHILFEKYWGRVRASTLRDLFQRTTMARTLHRTVYWRLMRTLESWLYSGGALLWAASREDARELELRFNRPKDTVSSIAHGVDSSKFSPPERARRREKMRQRFGVNDRRVLLLVTNDAHKKGMDKAIEAVALLPEDAVLALAGLVDSSEVERQATILGVGDRVRVWPHTGEIVDYYAAADVLVVPSREDAFSMPPLEAMACGIPTVVSRRAGVSELLEHELSSLILEDPEDASELAGHVRRLLEDEPLAQRLCFEGRKLAEQCSWDANAARAADLIEQEASTPRFLVLSPDPAGTGGIQRASRMLLKALAESYGPERVGLLQLWGGKDSQELPCRVLRSGSRVSRSNRVGAVDRLAYASTAAATALRWRRRLIIVCCHAHLAPIAWLCARLSGAPCVVWCHGRETWGRLRPLVRFSLRRADVLFAPSHFSARAVEAAATLSAGSVKVVPHCVDPELDGHLGSPLSEKRSPTALSVARLDTDEQYKGLDTVLHAWPEVNRRLPQAELVVVGEGADRPRLERIASVLGVEDRVRFRGRISDEELQAEYAGADVFVLPSRCRLQPRAEGEGFGLVFAEAGRQGLAVVAGAAGGASEAVADGESGILVDPDEPDQVASATIRVLSDGELARSLGEGGRARALDEFSYDRFRDAIRGLIRCTLAERMFSGRSLMNDVIQ